MSAYDILTGDPPRTLRTYLIVPQTGTAPLGRRMTRFVYEVGGDWCVTHFDDDTKVDAHPVAGQWETAARLGYPDADSPATVALMNRDHELFHSVIAEQVLGRDHSLALWQSHTARTRTMMRSGTRKQRYSRCNPCAISGWVASTRN